MTNYSASESSVRVDIFKPSGKWYQTVAVDMNDQYNHPNIHEALSMALNKAKPGWQESYADGWMFVCNEPYHINAHPIMLKGKNVG